MSGLYICRPGDTISGVKRSFSNLPKAEQDIYVGQGGSIGDILTDDNRVLVPGQALHLSGSHPSEGIEAVKTFQSACTARDTLNLSNIISDVGSLQTLGMSMVFDKYDLHSRMADLNTFGGGGLGAVTSRFSGFLDALKNYDEALAKYEAFRNHRARPAAIAPLREKYQAAFNKLQLEFGREVRALLKKEVPQVTFETMRSSPGNSRVVSTSVPLVNTPTAKGLAKLAKYGKGLGYGMIAVDGYLRTQMVLDTKRQGGDWEREAWVQGLSFAAGVAVGTVGFVFLISPLGLVGGAIVAGAAAYGADKAVSQIFGKIYDAIMGG